MFSGWVLVWLQCPPRLLLSASLAGASMGSYPSPTKSYLSPTSAPHSPSDNWGESAHPLLLVVTEVSTE